MNHSLSCLSNPAIVHGHQVLNLEFFIVMFIPMMFCTFQTYIMTFIFYMTCSLFSGAASSVCPDGRESSNGTCTPCVSGSCYVLERSPSIVAVPITPLSVEALPDFQTPTVHFARPPQRVFDHIFNRTRAFDSFWASKTKPAHLSFDIDHALKVIDKFVNGDGEFIWEDYNKNKR